MPGGLSFIAGGTIPCLSAVVRNRCAIHLGEVILNRLVLARPWSSSSAKEPAASPIESFSPRGLGTFSRPGVTSFQAGGDPQPLQYLAVARSAVFRGRRTRSGVPTSHARGFAQRFSRQV